MPQFKHSKNNNFQTGFAPIWIILLIFLLGGVFVLSRGNINFLDKLFVSQSDNTPKNSPSAKPAKSLSLREVCLEKIKDLPVPPYSYKDKNTRGTLLPLYKAKERFPNKEKASACITKYNVWEVREQAFKDMGFDYYKFDKSIGKNLLNYPAINNQFNPAVDRAYTELMKAKGWRRVTPEGEREGGLPYIVYSKEDGSYKMYTDVSQGTDQFLFVTLTIIRQ